MLFIVRKHANLKSQIPAFVTPYKCAEVATFAPAGNLTWHKALLCLLKVNSSEEAQSIREFC